MSTRRHLIQRLEARKLLAFSAEIVGEELRLTGTVENESVRVALVEGQVEVTGDDDETIASLEPDEFSSIVVTAGAGDDVVDITIDVPAQIRGEVGFDQIREAVDQRHHRARAPEDLEPFFDLRDPRLHLAQLAARPAARRLADAQPEAEAELLGQRHDAVGELERARGLAPVVLSRAIGDSATVTSPLIPWNSCGAYMAATLGVGTIAFAPFCFFNLLNPLVTIAFAVTGFRMLRQPNAQGGAERRTTA